MGLFSSGNSDSPVLVWEELKNENGPKFSYRSKITGGWLLSTKEVSTSGIGGGVTFIPDSKHEWDGYSV